MPALFAPTQDAAATADDLTYRRMHVLRGVIENTFANGSAQKVNEAREGGFEAGLAAGPVKGGGGKKRTAKIEEELVKTRTWFSAFDAWLGNRRGAGIIPMVLNRPFNVLGAVVAIFIASYTGVLLSVSNQPVWSDTWVLGGLFLASGLSGAAALLALLIRNRPDASFSLGRLHQADGYFSVLELALIIVFFITVGAAGALARELPWLPLWAIAVAGVAGSLVEARGHMRMRAEGGSGTVAGVRLDTVVVSVLVLLGVLALRAAVIFSAQ